MTQFDRDCWRLVGMLELYEAEGRVLGAGSAFGEGYIQSAARFVARDGLGRLAEQERMRGTA